MQNNLKEIQEFVRERFAKAAGHDLADYTETMIDGFGEPCLTLVDYPITLARVLNALEKVYGDDYHKMIFQDNKLLFLCAHEDLKMPCQFYWKFLNEDGADCTFEQRSEECQLAIAKLLGYAGGKNGN